VVSVGKQTTTSITRVLRAPRCLSFARSDALVRREGTRLQTKLTPVRHVIQRGAQAAVVVILERHETERLKNAIRRLLCGTEDLGHAVHWAGLRLKCNFDEITLPE
jgi:hypothetical protein